MSFIVEYNWDNAAPPRLKCTMPIKHSTLYELSQQISQKEVRPGEWLGIHECGLVTFRGWDVIEKKWFCSRPGAFNTEDGSIAIVECPVGYQVYHWTLEQLQRSIGIAGQDIRFLKVLAGGEFYYIPYEPHHENEVREKLARQHGYYTVLDAVV